MLNLQKNLGSDSPAQHMPSELHANQPGQSSGQCVLQSRLQGADQEAWQELLLREVQL